MLHIMKLRLICRRVAALVIAVAACLFSRQLRIQMSYSTIHVQYEHLSHIILASQILVHSASFIFPSAVVGIIASILDAFGNRQTIIHEFRYTRQPKYSVCFSLLAGHSAVHVFASTFICSRRWR